MAGRLIGQFNSFILALLLSLSAPLMAEDVDAVLILGQLEDNPVTFRQTVTVDWNAPVEAPGQAQKILYWTLSHLFGGYETRVAEKCGELTRALQQFEAQAYGQSWILLTISLGSNRLCQVEARSVYPKIIALTEEKRWPDLAVLAGAELGFFLVEQGADQGLRMLENANQLAREHSIDPTIANMLRGYSAAVLGMQNQHEKSIALQEELLQSPHLNQRRYQKAAIYFNLAMALLNSGKLDAKTKEYFQRGLEISSSLEDGYMRGLNEVSLSIIAFREERYDVAIALARSAYNVFEAVANIRWQGFALFRLTEALIAKKEYTEALEALAKARLAFPPADKRARMRIEELHAQIHEGGGQLREALDHQKKYFEAYKDFREQMAEEERAKQVASLELDISEARNRELSRTNELQAERLRSTQRLQIFLVVLGVALVVISMLFIYSAIQTRKARDRKRKIRRILDHIDEGIVTMDAHLKIEPEYSHYLQIFLGDERELTGLDALEVLFQKTLLSEEKRSMIRETLQVSLGEPALAWELNEGQLPREVVYQGEPARFAAMHWVPIFDRNRILQSVLLGIRDISAQRLLEAEVAHTKARSIALQKELGEIINAGVKPVVPLMKRVHQCLASLEGHASAADVLPELHTIKGIARGLNLQVLSQGTHELEIQLKQGTDGWAEGLSHFREIVEGYEQLLDMFHLDRMAIQVQKFQLLQDALQLVLPALMQQLGAAGLQLTALTVDDRVGTWDADVLRILADVLLHAFTNSADHGYILPMQEGRSVRDPVFHLSALRVGEGIEVKLRDQGAGLNRERIEAIARQRNFQPEADQELWDVLLEQDVSTASGVSQTSGRGIGLAAIQRALKTCGGRVHIRPCVEGPGTELTMEFPGGPLRASA